MNVQYDIVILLYQSASELGSRDFRWTRFDSTNRRNTLVGWDVEGARYSINWNQSRTNTGNCFASSLVKRTIEYGNRSLCNVGWPEKQSNQQVGTVAVLVAESVSKLTRPFVEHVIDSTWYE